MPGNDAQKEAQKRRKKREEKALLSAAKAKTAPPTSFKVPQHGRRLGGGSNGGVDDADELRRVRLKAIARQERKSSIQAQKMASAKKEASGGRRDATTEPRYGDGGKSDVVDPVLASATKILLDLPGHTGSRAQDGTAELAAAVAATLPNLEDALVLCSTARTVLENARERPDRRTLRCSNASVWSKLVRWESGRRLLELAGFVPTKDFPKGSSNNNDGEEGEEEEAQLTEAELERWRSTTKFALEDESARSPALLAVEEALQRWLEDRARDDAGGAGAGGAASACPAAAGLPSSLAGSSSIQAATTTATDSSSSDHTRPSPSKHGLLQSLPPPMPSTPSATPPLKITQGLVSRGAAEEGDGSADEGSGGGGGGGSGGLGFSDGLTFQCSAAAVEGLLSSLGLGQYAPALFAQGYDDPSIWGLLTVGEFEEMCSLARMLPGHRVKLAAAISDRDVGC